MKCLVLIGVALSLIACKESRPPATGASAEPQLVPIENAEKVTEEAERDLPQQTALGYGTSRYSGRITLGKLPAGCKMVEKSNLPGCSSSIGAELAVSCGRYGDFCLVVTVTDDQTVAERLVRRNLLVHASCRQAEYRRWRQVTVVTSVVNCNQEDSSCRYEMATTCPWMTGPQTEGMCFGQAEAKLFAFSPPSPSMEGKVFASVITGTWPLEHIERGKELFKNLSQNYTREILRR